MPTRTTAFMVQVAPEASVGNVTGTGALLLATEWPQYRSLDWRAIRNAMRGTRVINGRNVLGGALLSSLGFTYAGVGVGRPPAASPRMNDYILDLASAVEAHAVAD